MVGCAKTKMIVMMIKRRIPVKPATKVKSSTFKEIASNEIAKSLAKIPTGHCFKQPKGDSRPRVAGKADFTREAAKMRYRLRRNVIKIDYVTNRMQHRKKKCRTCCDLVELYVRV